jgi:phosphatidylinositol-3-phosphatase
LGVVTTADVPSSVAATATSPCGTSHQARVTHVVWILLENEGYSVMGSPSAPYLNALATHCGLATNDVAVSHPGLPNYIALTSGSTQGITDDAEPSSHPLNVPSIFSELKGNWRALAESMPSACDRVTSGSYAARHNPAVYYTNLPTCSRDDVPLTSPLNLSAAFTFITPNICNDMHSCPVSTGDAWLKSHVPQIVSSPQYRTGSLALFITFDENNLAANNQIPTIVVAPSVPKGLRVSKSFTHYSLLRTTEALLHVPSLGGARSANSMVTPFHL